LTISTKLNYSRLYQLCVWVLLYRVNKKTTRIALKYLAFSFAITLAYPQGLLNSLM